jgi:hypothetical protein
MTRTIQNETFLQITCAIELGIAIVKKRMYHTIIVNNFIFYIILDSSFIVTNMIVTGDIYNY